MSSPQQQHPPEQARPPSKVRVVIGTIFGVFVLAVLLLKLGLELFLPKPKPDPQPVLPPVYAPTIPNPGGGKASHGGTVAFPDGKKRRFSDIQGEIGRAHV